MNANGIYSLFNTAIAHNLKWPKIRLVTPNNQTVILRRNGAKSKYPGTIAVTDDRPFGSNSYFGRIETDGRLIPGWNLNSDVQNLLESLDSNPVDVASKYGHLTGHCCFCELPLKDARSTAVGYGPVCADHFGLYWG